MTDIIRESAFGQILRLTSRSRHLRYPEEREGFEIPWKVAASKEKQNSVEAPTSPNTVDPTAEEVKESRLDRPLTAHHSLYRKTTEVDTDSLRVARSRQAIEPSSEDRFEVEQQQYPVERTQSAIIEPQVTKDGVILVDWYTTDDPENPQNWSSSKKAYVAFLVFIYTFVVYCASAIYISSEAQIMERFVVGQSKAALGLSLYVLGYGVGPLLFSPLSEVPYFGRNLPYITSFALFVILGVPLALVDNFPGLLVLRFLTGFMGSPCLANGGATMQDIYSLIGLPYALSVWVAAVFAAPALGPLLSGFAVPAENWRWSLWIVLWISGPVFIVWFISMPETSSPNILLRRAKRLRKLTNNPNYRTQSEINQGTKTLGTVVYDALLVPVLICIQDPAVLYANVYSSFIYGTYYSFFEAFPLVYIEKYGFNQGELGMTFLSIIVGCVLGLTCYYAYLWWYLGPDIKKHGLRAQEHRLVPAMIAVWLLPISLFWFGWTSHPPYHYIISIVAMLFYATGAFILFQCILIYLPLTYPHHAASLFAANDACRSALAAGAVIFARPMYINLGIGRGVSILGGLMVGGALGIAGLWWWGEGLRKRSKFALS